MNNYEISKSTLCVDSIAVTTKTLYSKAIRKADHKSLQDLSNALCVDFDLVPFKVIFDGHRLSKERPTWDSRPNKVVWALTEKNTILVFSMLPTTDRKVTNGEAVKGLLYELLKAYDVQILKLEKSIRTSGYYSRFNDLVSKLA